MTKKPSKLINNPVDRPAHYTSHPSGIEAIEICGYMGFNTGNAFKYVFRMENKWDPVEDLKKSNWYIDRELFQRGFSTKDDLVYHDFYTDWACVMKSHDKTDLIYRIVGKSPGNLEKALFYVWCADLYKTEWWGLKMAKVFINQEIEVRTKKGQQ